MEDTPLPILLVPKIFPGAIMKSLRRATARLGCLLLLCALAVSAPARAEDIEISQYGAAPGGMPYAVALAKGYFKEFGADVTGIRSSPGGAPTIRNLLAGGLTYGEAGLTAILAGIRGGADLKIIVGSVNTVAEVFWATMPDSPVQSIKDLKGRRIGFTTPQSTTQALALMLLDGAGLSKDDARLSATGGFGQALTALEHGGLDVAPIVEPTYTASGAKYRTLAGAREVFPPLANVMGVTTTKKIQERPDFLRGVILARRKAVEFMEADPAAAAEIVAAAYKMDRAVVDKVIRNMLAVSVQGVKFWGPGDIRYDGLNNMVQAQKLIGSDLGTVDWSQIVDETFLPADLRSRR